MFICGAEGPTAGCGRDAIANAKRDASLAAKSVTPPPIEPYAARRRATGRISPATLRPKELPDVPAFAILRKPIFSAFREPRPQDRLFCRTGLRPLTPLKSVPSSPGANAPGLAAFIRLGTRKSGLRDVRPLHAALNTDPRQAPPRRLRGSGCFVSAMLAGTRCCEAACGLRASLLGDAQTSFSQEGASAFGTAITPVAAGSCVVL